MDKPTPAPWAAFTDGMHTNIVHVGETTKCVFSLPGRDKNEPDVRLATAAPAMLEALLVLLPGLVLDLRYADDDDDKGALAARVQTVQSAIAKAVGSPPAHSGGQS